MQIFASLLIAIALSSFAILPDAQATTYTVNTSSDSVVANACENHLSGCSLRGAILAANAHSGDTIVFNIFELCGIDGCFINLLSALPDISAPMSIAGPSTYAIRRSSSAATNFRFFNVTTTGTVNISDLAIKQGRAGSANGGGLQNSTGTVIIGNSANQGDPTASGGGAICNGDHNHSQGGFLTVTNTTITGNSALRCGGISTAGGAAAGELTVTNSTIVGNSSFYSDSAGAFPRTEREGP